MKHGQTRNGPERPVLAGLPDVAYAMQRQDDVVRPRMALTATGQPGQAPEAKGTSRSSRERTARGTAPIPRGARGRSRRDPTRIGVISDTHGYLDPDVCKAFSGVTHIVHAGDIGDRSVLTALETIAPVTAVSGNIEPEELVASLPREAASEVDGVRFVVAHKRKRLFKRLAAGKVPAGLDDVPDLVIYGHDHVPAASWVEGTLFLNPGTASAPDSEDDDPTVAIVEVRDAGLAVTFVPLARRDS